MGVHPVCLLASRAAWWVRCWLGCGVGAYLIASAALAATPVTLVTYRAAESALDRRNDYTIAVLKLALDKTRDEYGDYLLQPSLPMNTARARQALLTNSYENFIVKFSYDPELERAGLKRGGFEPDLDITSYRICFTRRTLLPELSQIGSLPALRPFSHGQGSVSPSCGITVLPCRRWVNTRACLKWSRRVDLTCFAAASMKPCPSCKAIRAFRNWLWTPTCCSTTHCHAFFIPTPVIARCFNASIAVWSKPLSMAICRSSG